MSVGIMFGDCLKEILLARGWPTTRLSKELNIDSSYVRKWISGERVPTLNSSYVQNISTVICEGLNRDYNKKTEVEIKKAIDLLGIQYNKTGKIDEIVNDVLKETQIYSLSLDKDRRKNNKHKKEQVDFLGNILGITGKWSTSDNPSLIQDEVYQNNLANIPPVIKSRESIINTMIAILKIALEDSGDNSGEIILSFYGENELFHGYTEQYRCFNSLIIKALNNGWDMKHICKLSINIERTFSLIQNIVNWSGYPGSYELFYHNKYGINNPPYEIIIIKGKGALVCFATENNHEIDSALYLSNNEATNIIHGYAYQILFNTNPLIKKINSNELFELNVEKGKKSGNHFVCTYDIDFLTMPYELIVNYLSRTIKDEKERFVHLSRVKKCLDSLYIDLNEYKEYHIIPMRSIEYLVKNGRYYYDNSYYCPTKEDIILHIRHIIYLLKAYKNFNIALIGESDMYLMNQIHWDIKGNHTLILSIIPKNDMIKNPVLLEITEGTLINAFQDFFMDLWERVNPINKDKEYVISWFENLLQ